MVTQSIVSRLADDGLRQHVYAAPTAVAEACSANGSWCWSSGDCCSGWCAWSFHCGWK